MSSFWLLESIEDWGKYLNMADDVEFAKTYRHHLNTGRPFGDEEFIGTLEKKLGIMIRKKKPGRKPKK